MIWYDDDFIIYFCFILNFFAFYLYLSLSPIHTHTHNHNHTYTLFSYSPLSHTLSFSLSLSSFFHPLYLSLLSISQSIFFSLPIPLFSFYLNLSFCSPYFSISHTLHPYMTHYCTAIVSFPFSNGFLGIMDKAMINVTDTLEAVADSIFTYGENVVHLVRWVIGLWVEWTYW